jgi:uncharacterized NAD(P)/FAD-binding protein YdhS/mannose-6-phosphate isomerase-like protein (cupin superfamily)
VTADPHPVPELADLMGPFDVDALAAALTRPLDLSALLPHARFDDARYVRVPLVARPEYEVRLLCWKPGQSSALHGHGRSACAFRVVAGEAHEARLDGSVSRLGPGEVARAEHDAVHQVSNLGRTPLVTLHLYAPPLPVGQPSSSDGHRVVVVGGGFSGVALAIHLLSTEDADLRVTLVEPGPSLGRGVAYGTRDRSHLLNVPAKDMSVDPARPDDFVEWLRERGNHVAPTALVSRADYGDYVEQRLARAIERSPAKLRLARVAATGVTRRDDGTWAVALADGRVLDADDVVLATGHGPPVVPPALRTVAHDPRIERDPWRALDRIAPGDRVLLVGTGLTALDVLCSLDRVGHRAPVVAVSRHGRWPHPHLSSVVWTGAVPPLDLDAAPRTADGLAEWLKSSISLASTREIPWQAVLGALRPHVATLWRRLPSGERSRFLEVYRAKWEVLRHRAPASTRAALDQWHDLGWVTTRRGGIVSATAEASGIVVRFDGGGLQVFDRVVLAAGHQTDPERFDDPLWQGLLRDGHVAPDPHGFGVVADANGRISDRPGLWAIGALLRGQTFEATAVPDLSKQVAGVAAALVLARASVARAASVASASTGAGA